VQSEGTASLNLISRDYPGAKCYLLYRGNEEYQAGDISVMPLENALRKFVNIPA
jgi:hypothetical protein